MSFAESLSPLFGRMLLCWFFLSEALARLGEWSRMVAELNSEGVPAAPAILGLTLGAMMFGGASLLVGFQTRFSAMVLAVLTFSWSFIRHDFWRVADAATYQAEYELFALGMAVIAGLLVLAGLGGGRFAFDKSGKQK